MKLTSKSCRKGDGPRGRGALAARLLENHQCLGIARRAAGHLKRKFPWVPSDDLYSYALFGLVRAANNYNPDRCVPFAIYACRKAMFVAIDEMRRDRVLWRGCHNPRANTVSLDRLLVTDQPNWWRVCDQRAERARSRLEARDWCETMLSQLDAQDRRLMMLRYADDMTFRQIGEVMGRSESTVCLRHRTLINRFRGLAGEFHHRPPPEDAEVEATS